MGTPLSITHTPETLPLPMYLNPGPGHWLIRDEQGKIGIDNDWLTFSPLTAPKVWGKQDAVSSLPVPRGSLVMGIMRKAGGGYCQPLALVNCQSPSLSFCGNVEAGVKTDLSSWLTTCQAFTTGPPYCQGVL